MTTRALLDKATAKQLLALARELGVCGIALLLIVLHLLGYIPANDEPGTAHASPPPPSSAVGESSTAEHRPR